MGARRTDEGVSPMIDNVRPTTRPRSCGGFVLPAKQVHRPVALRSAAQSAYRHHTAAPVDRASLDTGPRGAPLHGQATVSGPTNRVGVGHRCLRSKIERAHLLCAHRALTVRLADRVVGRIRLPVTPLVRGTSRRSVPVRRAAHLGRGKVVER